MQLVMFAEGGFERLGAWRQDGIVDLVALGFPRTLAAFIRAAPATLPAAVAVPRATAVFPLEEVQLQAPLTQPTKIVAIGVNYLDHCREQGIEPPKEPLVFGKFPSALTGPFDPIVWDPVLTQQVDPEVELGVIIGERCHHVAVDQALHVVFGYTVVNDVSARDLQFGDGQWTRGKNLDTFLPHGPAIVTADEVPNPQQLTMQLWVNDRLQQDGTTSDMIFSVAEIIAHVSQFCTLEPGDLIITGTPKGVGCFRKPPIYLEAGDVVRCAIERLGEIVNPTHIIN